MHSALKSMLKQTVTVEPFLSRSDYGFETYGAAVQYPARITEEIVVIRQRDGSEKVARHKVRLDGDAVVDPRDRITFPDGSQPPILAVERYADEFGGVYTVVVRTE